MLQTVESNIMPSSQKKLKILFYHAGDIALGNYLYPTALVLKTWIDSHDQSTAQQLEWLLPIQFQLTTDDLVKHIEHTKADVLCTSHYIWNHSFLLDQLTAIPTAVKSRLTVIAGGPSIDVHTNPDFFTQWPLIDYAVYGAGEQAFADIMAHLVNQKSLIALNTSNCAWQNAKTGKTQVAGYRPVKINQRSIFLSNREFLARMVKDAKKQAEPIWLPYEITRGCPYACTFCDWNSGFDNKVSRRKNTYQDEIDLFQQVGLTNIFIADANTGQYAEDLDVIEYFAKKNIKENAGFKLAASWSKLQKQNNYRMWKHMVESQLVHRVLTFSIQDINPQILKNIDRPDVSWDVHLAMANDLRNQYPHLIIKSHIIYGLPGQTPGSLITTLSTLAKAHIWPTVNINEPLPTSPAILDPEYQQKFGFEYVVSTRLQDSKRFQTRIPKSCVSFNQHDIVTMNLIGNFYMAVIVINLFLHHNQCKTLDAYVAVNNLLLSDQYGLLHNNLYHNWTSNNDFFYTIEFGNKTHIQSDLFYESLVLNPKFLQWLLPFVPVECKAQFSRLTLSSKLHEFIQDLHVNPD